MKILLTFLIFFSLFFRVLAEEVKVIELHNKTFDQILLNETEDQIITDEVSENIEVEKDNNNQELINSNSTIEEGTITIIPEEISPNKVIMSFPDFWENADKDDLLFLFDNLLPTKSFVLNNALIKSLSLDSTPPQNFSDDQFKHLRIINLIKLGQRQKAFNMIDTINKKTDYEDFFNLFKLNYYFSSYAISQACEFTNSINRKNSNIDKNFLLKTDIFCTFIKDKIEEADFLNSILQEMNDQDEYFQKIFLNLKESNNIQEDFSLVNYDENSISLYSAMMRVGEMSLNNNFLMYDPINFSIPIIHSQSSDISLRLKAAHKAYQHNMLSAESLSAMYRTVDFSYEELTNNEFEKINNNNVELRMSYLFQKANIQLLPITRVQSLVDFWSYAEKENLNLLAYDISRSLIDKIEPSIELSEYGIEIAKAHIYNNNFELADKWIVFAKNYQSEDENYLEKIQSTKLLLNLKKSTNENQFIKILLESEGDLLLEISEDTVKQEIFLTILSIINDDKDKFLGENKKLLDERAMPSRYLLNKIKKSFESSNYGELLLSISISMINKTWTDIHPEHLRIILIALQDVEIEHIFKNIVFEILEISEII